MPGVLLVSVLENRVWSISPIFFEAAIPNLVCRYILGPQIGIYCFQVTVTLISGFSSRKVESRAFFNGVPVLPSFMTLGELYIYKQKTCVNQLFNLTPVLIKDDLQLQLNCFCTIDLYKKTVLIVHCHRAI